ncbi:hypothetical protein [Fusibacter ferrireducens]|uniref:Uncharacterized protein n=1 Tax=Fusibacter ferrireducens TaxID=2785058 RepID=A0ABS0A2F0_9FIRM|nr:hypothetical protein [Fusibacter ferrireducens]MBF4696064.1 hypothetical protein [Fusibacter ferrireducens]
MTSVIAGTLEDIKQLIDRKETISMFEKCMITEIEKFYKDNNISYKINSSFNDKIIDYINLRKKWISPKRREILVSKELNKKIRENLIDFRTKEALVYIQNKIRKGENINGHLSRSIYRSDFYDVLLLQWGIFHVHINKKEAKNSREMKKNRSDELLFIMIENDIVYLIDIEKHDKKHVFSMFRLLQIISTNWIELIKKYELKDCIAGTMKPLITCDKDIEMMWKAKINIGFEINGKTYLLWDKGVNSAGSGMIDTFQIKQN